MKMDLRASSREESAYSSQVLQTRMRSLVDSGLVNHSAHDEDTHVTEKKESGVSNAKVDPSVSQAEKRSEHLEQLLEEMYERNYALVEVVNTLTREKEEIQTKLDQWKGTDVQDLVCKVLDEKSDLQKKISRLGMVLRDMGLNESGHQMNFSNEMEDISMMGMDPERPTALTNYLENKARSLQVENEKLEVENDDHRRQVEELQAKVWNLESAIPVKDEDSICVSLRYTLSSRSECEASDHERLLAFSKVLELQKQVSELKKSEQQIVRKKRDKRFK